VHLACAFNSHQWIGCKCIRCGRTRRHRWSIDTGRCARCGACEGAHDLVESKCVCGRCGERFHLWARDRTYWTTCKMCGRTIDGLVLSGDTDSLVQYLASGGDPNWAPLGSRSLLNVAAQYANLSAIEVLLKVGVGPRAAQGRTVLIELAAEYCESPDRVIAALARAGAKPNLRDAHGMTALSLAAGRGDAQQVIALIKAGADTNQPCGGWVPLMRAKGVAVIEALLKGGAEVAPRSTSGPHALLLHTNDPAAVELLLQAGADPNARDEDGSTALMWAMNPHETIYSTRTDEESVARVQVVEALLRAGADPNAKNKYGKTALARARSRGRLEAIEPLTKGGAIA
jgi:ankyrin repeat protein